MIIFCDFDGVICEDTIDKLFDSQNDFNQRIDIENRYKNGEISFADCIQQITSRIAPCKVPISQFKIDPSFINLLKFAQANDIKFYVLSSGDADLINDIIKHHSAILPSVIANHYDFYSGYNSFYEKPDHPEFRKLIANNQEAAVYIGDGVSDIGVINQHLFAKVFTLGYLTSYCCEQQIDHVPVQSLQDVQQELENTIISEIIETKPQSKLLLSPGVVRAYQSASENVHRHFTNMHRSESYHKLHKLWSYHLLSVLNSNRSEYTPCVITGSGTSSMDIVIESLVFNQQVLFLSNGMFGERWIDIGKNYNKTNTHSIQLPWGTPFDHDQVVATAKLLGVKYVVFVHHDTSVGICNNLNLVNKLDQSGIISVVDCVSSFACYPIDLTSCPIGIFITNPNKGLGSYQGIGIVIVKNTITVQPSYKYMDLHKHVKLALRNEPTNTPCMIAISSSLEVLRTLDFNSVCKRYQTVSELFEQLYSSVSDLGLNCLLSKKHMFKGLLTIKLANSNDFIDYCSKQIVVYPGKGDLDNKYFQISLYGQDATAAGINQFISYLKKYTMN